MRHIPLPLAAPISLSEAIVTFEKLIYRSRQMLEVHMYRLPNVRRDDRAQPRASATCRTHRSDGERDDVSPTSKMLKKKDRQGRIKAKNDQLKFDESGI